MHENRKACRWQASWRREAIPVPDVDDPPPGPLPGSALHHHDDIDHGFDRRLLRVETTARLPLPTW